MRSGFFDSDITGYDGEGMPVFDRAEDAAFFARYFSRFLSTGVCAEPADSLQVCPGTGLAVRVRPGYCFIQGYMGWQEEPQDFPLSAPSSGSRVDGVFLRLSLTDRAIGIRIAAGDVQPTRNDSVYELLLAAVTVRAGTAQLAAEDIADMRGSPELCGYVSGLGEMTRMWNELARKVDREEGKGLSSQDYTLGEKNKLAGLSAVATSGSYDDLLNKPAAYAHPSSHPASMITGLAAVATSGSYDDLTNKPAASSYVHPDTHPASMITGLAAVATSGSYTDLTNRPAAYVHPGSHPVSMITGLATVATSGSYNDLSNRPPSYSAVVTIYNSWGGTTPPYTQNVAISGITAAMQPLISPVYSATLSTALAQKEAWACVNKAVSYDGGIAFTCFEDKPIVDIIVQIKVVG